MVTSRRWRSSIARGYNGCSIENPLFIDNWITLGLSWLLESFSRANMESYPVCSANFFLWCVGNQTEKMNARWIFIVFHGSIRNLRVRNLSDRGSMFVASISERWRSFVVMKVFRRCIFGFFDHCVLLLFVTFLIPFSGSEGVKSDQKDRRRLWMFVGYEFLKKTCDLQQSEIEWK